MWHLLIDGQQIGPIDEKAIKEALLKKECDEETMVWRAGFGKWEKLKDTELLNLVKNNPQADVFNRKIPLGLLIFLMPVVFSWMTLKKGNSVVFRILSFVWLFLWISVLFDDQSTPASKATTSNDEVEFEIVKAECGGWMATKEVRITDLRKDQASVDFFAKRILYDTWVAAAACPDSKGFEYIIFLEKTKDRKGKVMPNFKIIIPMSPIEARKFPNEESYYRDKMTVAVMREKIKQTPLMYVLESVSSQD